MNQNPPTHHPLPLHLSGDTTQEQQDKLRENLNEAAQRIFRSALKELDQHSARLVLEVDEKMKTEIASAALKIIRKLTISEKYQD